MAEFNEEKAKELIVKFELDERTIRVWRTRGKIPDKYFRDDYVKRIPITERVDILLSDRIIAILRMKELNVRFLEEIVQAPLADIASGKSTFTAEELIRTKKEINRLKIDMVKHINFNSGRGVSNIVSDDRIKYYVIFRYTLNDNEIKQILHQTKSEEVAKYLFEKIKDAVAKFCLQLNL